jgi:hypothetical protein
VQTDGELAERLPVSIGLAKEPLLLIQPAAA